MAATEPGPRGGFGESAHADQHAGASDRSSTTGNYGLVGDVYTCFCFQVGLVRDVQRYALILNDDGEQPEEEAPPRRASAGRSGET